MGLEEEKAGAIILRAEVTVPSSPGLLWYYFKIIQEGRDLYFGNNPSRTGGVGEIAEDIPAPYQIPVYLGNLSTPAWLKETVAYQVFVDRFFNGCPESRILNPKKNTLLHSHWDNTPIYIRDMETGNVVHRDFMGGNLLREAIVYISIKKGTIIPWALINHKNHPTFTDTGSKSSPMTMSVGGTLTACPVSTSLSLPTRILLFTTKTAF